VLIGAIGGLIMLGIGLSGIGGFIITPVIIGALLFGLFFYLRSNRISAQKQFEDER
jgi:hypothetical protein